MTRLEIIQIIIRAIWSSVCVVNVIRNTYSFIEDLDLFEGKSDRTAMLQVDIWRAMMWLFYAIYTIIPATTVTRTTLSIVMFVGGITSGVMASRAAKEIK